VSEGGGTVNCAGGPPRRVSVVVCVAVKPGCGAGGFLETCGAWTEAVGAIGRAPGWGGGGPEFALEVVVAGCEKGVVRVGWGLVSAV
jgi:hypothetical protein